MFYYKRLGRFSGILTPISCAVFSISLAHAQTILPTDPTVISGDIAFSLPDAGHMGIDQTSVSGIINWGSFSIGSGDKVSIRNGNGATLNRVIGSDYSQILGALNATGSVYLLNQNGVFFGDNGVIQTGGDFVASALDLTDSDFLNGGDTLFKGDSTAGVLNFGQIGSLGGDVALIARTVVNEGSISAPNGTAALIAGREVLMRDIALDNGMFVVRVGGEDSSVTDKGSLLAATAELRANGGNIYALAGNTNGTIHATGVHKAGGRVFLTANGGTVKTTKTISAQRGSGAGGDIIVNAANIEASNLFDASAFVGDGGFVELFATAEAAFSGQILAYGDDTSGLAGFAEVSGVKLLSYTGSTDTGGGTLLLDPNNIEISTEGGNLSGASVIDPDILTSNLRLQDVIIQTTGNNGTAGTIYVDENVLFRSQYDLTLLAHGDIIVAASILNQDTANGDINLVSGWNGATSTTNFSSTPFDTANFANPVIYGNASGAAYTLFGSDFNASGMTQLASSRSSIAVGTVSGHTRVYARDVQLLAQDQEGPSSSSMLGARVDNVTPFLVSSDDSGSVFGFIGDDPITGDISVRASGSILLESSETQAGFAQIGHVGSAVSASGGTNSATASGDILVEAADDITLDAGNANGTYAMIGHGSIDICEPQICTQSSGTRQGNITVFAGDEISLEDGQNTTTTEPAPVLSWVGHGTANPATISNANIDIEAGSFDQDTDTSIGAGAAGHFNPEIISAGLNGGSFILVANDSGLAFASGDTITATDGNLLIDAETSLQFGSGFNITDFGTTGQYALSTAGQFSNLQGETLFDIGSGNWFIYSERPDTDTGGLGTLDAETIVYGYTLDSSDPFMMNFRDDENRPLNSNANTLVYSVDPQLTIDPLSVIYGQDNSVSPTYRFTVAGVDADPADFGFQDLAFNLDPTVVALSDSGFVNVGTYTDGVRAEFNIPSDDLYFGFDETGLLTVTPATLRVTLADEIKNDGVGYTGAVSYSGFVTGEDDTLITSGPRFTFSGGNGSEGLAPGNYTVRSAGTVESSGNYIFDETDTAFLTIEAGVIVDPEPDPPADIPELPPEQNPLAFVNRQISIPVLVNAVDGLNDEAFVEVSTINTDKMVNQLQRGKQFCEGLAQQEYVIDCMGDSLQKAAQGLPEGGDYAAVRAALDDAAAKLAALARQNASTSLTRGLVQANGQQSSRRLTPVATEALTTLNAQASAIIEEAQTILLRSAQNSERRQIHYQRIAEAVGSNKLLLRSS